MRFLEGQRDTKSHLKAALHVLVGLNVKYQTEIQWSIQVMVIYQGIVSKYKTVPMKRFRVGQPSHRFRWRVALQNLLGNTECDLVEEKIELIDFLTLIKSVNWQELLVMVSPAHTMDGKTAMYTPSPPYAASQSKSGITGTSTLRRTSEISPSDCTRRV